MRHSYYIEKIVSESLHIKSFYLRPALSSSPINFRAGQFVNLHVTNAQGEQFTRSYSLSDSPNKNYVRLSIKHESMGKLSTYLHQVATVGDQLELSEAMGDFQLSNSQLPVVFISAGVGISPIMSMLEQLYHQTPQREVHFLHVSRNKAEQAFAERLRLLQSQLPNMQLRIYHTQAGPTEEAGKDYHVKGYLQTATLAEFTTAKHEFYLCGPSAFMENIQQGLGELGVPETQIFYEFFGKQKSNNKENLHKQTSSITVNFVKSNQQIPWDSSVANLLELAEAAAIPVDSLCRMGTCGRCETKLLSGQHRYEPAPFMDTQENHLLLCCAIPTTNISLEA